MTEPSMATKPPDTGAINKWIIVATTVLGSFMSVMDVSVVNVSLPHMMGSFGQDLSSITWVATSYTIAEIIMVTMTGWWSTFIGRKRLYLWSYGLFTIGSILCGTAQTFPQLIVYRVLQGIGGGALIPVSTAIMREAFPPEEQGMAIAINGMGVVLAPALGPIIGGWLTDQYGWPWIFYINVPVSIIAISMAVAFIHDPPYLRRGIKKIDWAGIILLAVTLTGMQIILERGQSENWFESNLITVGTVVTSVAALIMIWWEMKTKEPVVNLRILRNLRFTVGSSVGMLFGLALFGTTFVLPQFTQQLLGYPAFEAGLVLAPRAVMLIIMFPVTGHLIKYMEPRNLILIGAVVTIWSYHDLSQLSLQVGFWNMVPMLVVMGIGMPLVFTTLGTVALSNIPRPDMTDATSLYTLTRRVGGNIGYALGATWVSRGFQIHRSHLVSHVTASSPQLLAYTKAGTALASQTAIGAAAAPQASLGLVDMVVNRQAAMLAYNDTSFYFGLLYIAIIPLAFLLPKRSELYTPTKH